MRLTSSAPVVAKYTQRDPEDETATTERCTYIVKNTTLNASLARLIIDYAFPTPAQEREMRDALPVIRQPDFLYVAAGRGNHTIQFFRV